MTSYLQELHTVLQDGFGVQMRLRPDQPRDREGLSLSMISLTGAKAISIIGIQLSHSYMHQRCWIIS
jgi:hypothetical protein